MKNIITIAKKELLGYFLSPVGYIFAGLLMIVCGSLFFNDLFLSGQADLRPYWGIVGFLLSLFVPALTMGLIADEKKNGTWEILLSLPVSHLQVVAGKFLGGLIYLVFVLSLSVSTVVTVFLLGKPDLGLVFGGVFGLLLTSGAYMSLGIFMSCLTTQSVVAFLATSIALILNSVMGQEFLLARLPPIFRNVVGGLSLSFRSSRFSSGLIEIGDLVFFVSWMIIFLTLAVLVLRGERPIKMKNIASYITGINIIVGLVVLNVLLSFYPLLRVDLTGNRAHSLSTASKEVILSLDDVVRIKVYLTAALPAEIKPISESLKTTLEEFQNLNRSKIKVTYLDPNKDEKAKSEADKYGIVPLQFSSIKSDKFEMSNGYFGMAILYGPKEEVIPVAGDVGNLEYFLVSNIKKLIRKDSPVIALADETVVSEKSLIQLLSKYLQQNYNVIDVKIDSDGELPKFAETLIIVDRKTKISDNGILKLKDWLDQKKGLIVFQDRFAVDQTMVSRKIDDTGLEQIMKDNGIEVEDKMVLDKSSVVANFGSQNGTFAVQYPYWVAVNPDNIDRSIPVMSGINSMVFPWVSPLKMGDGARSLFTSSDLTILDENGSDVSPLTKKNLDSGNTGKLVMSALNPEKKFAVVGDADFVKDQFVSIYQQNLVFALNLVDYFSQDQSLMAIRGKSLRTTPLKPVNDSWKLVIKIGNIAFPILVLTLTALCFNYFRKIRNQDWFK